VHNCLENLMAARVCLVWFAFYLGILWVRLSPPPQIEPLRPSHLKRGTHAILLFCNRLQEWQQADNLAEQRI
jgi:hypothetical protein